MSHDFVIGIFGLDEFEELLASKRESALGPDGLPKSVYRSAGGIGQFLFATYQAFLQGSALWAGFDASRTVFISSTEVDAQGFLFFHLNLCGL